MNSIILPINIDIDPFRSVPILHIRCEGYIDHYPNNNHTNY